MKVGLPHRGLPRQGQGFARIRGPLTRLTPRRPRRVG